jgi:hypothetical protein
MKRLRERARERRLQLAELRRSQRSQKRRDRLAEIEQYGGYAEMRAAKKQQFRDERAATREFFRSPEGKKHQRDMREGSRQARQKASEQFEREWPSILAELRRRRPGPEDEPDVDAETEAAIEDEVEEELELEEEEEELAELIDTPKPGAPAKIEPANRFQMRRGLRGGRQVAPTPSSRPTHPASMPNPNMTQALRSLPPKSAAANTLNGAFLEVASKDDLEYGTLAASKIREIDDMQWRASFASSLQQFVSA